MMGNSDETHTIKPAFTYARYQVDVGPKNMRKMKEEGVDIPDPDEKLVMDNVDQMNTMYAIGKHAAGQVDMQTHFAKFMP